MYALQPQPRSTPDRLVTTHLEMKSPEQLRAGFAETPGVEVRVLTSVDVDFYRALYRSVGEQWNWRDRLIMSDEELAVALDKAEVNVLYVDGEIAGYVELADQHDGSTEVAYFGLREAFFGRGLGKHLLSYGVKKAWEKGANRVWVHTCNLDGPQALKNYMARGFEVVHVDEEPMPDRYK